jgi:hypothetical protein
MKEKSNQTALEWLIEQWPILESQIPTRILEQAKEIQRKQSQEYAEFCVHCDRNNLPLLDFEGFINLKSEE